MATNAVLQYPREKPLFSLLMVLAIPVWLALVGFTFGIALLYLLFFWVIYLFAQSGFIAMLRGGAVEVTPEQFPDLHARFVRACDRLGITERPYFYLQSSEGILNAFATRFLGSQYVVLYSSIVDALDDDPDALDFYIGHELGHIRLKHLTWGWVLIPVGWLPLVGAAYRRAQERSCDLHGSACCDNDASTLNAIGVLAAGHTRWKTLNHRMWLHQVKLTGGFWMSFHELTADYPWLTKRMAFVIEARGGEKVDVPSRHGLAWFFAFFVPRFGGGGGAASLLITVAMVGILAAVAIPAYQDYVRTAEAAKAQAALEQKLSAGEEVAWDEVRQVMIDTKATAEQQEALRHRVFMAYVAPQVPEGQDMEAIYADFAARYPLPADEAAGGDSR